VAMLAEVVDGVIGVDTHRDFNQVEIARPSGAVIATCTFTNDSAVLPATAALCLCEPALAESLPH
jgi:hypothetical protein